MFKALGKALRMTTVSLIAVAFIAFTIVFFMPFFLSSGYVKNKLVKGLEQRTGKVMTVAGDFRILPGFDKVTLRVGDVTVTNPEGSANMKPLVRMRAMEASVPWKPLLSGEVQINDITFDEPAFFYEVDAVHNSNWRAAAGQLEAAPRTAKVGSIGFNKLMMTDARIHYKKEGKPEEIVRFDSLTVEPITDGSGEEGDEPVLVTTDLSWRETKFSVIGRINRLADVLAGERVKVDVDVASDVVQGNFSGAVAPGAALTYVGTMRADVASLRDLATVFNKQLPGTQGLHTLSLAGSINGDPSRIAFETTRMRLDDTQLQAKGTLTRGGARPRFDAEVSADRIDLAAYLVNGSEAASGPVAIDLSGLKAIDGRIAMKFRELAYAPALLQDGDLVAKIEAGVAEIDLVSVTGYGGKGQGAVRLDASAAEPALSGKLQMTGLQAGPVLRSFTTSEKLAGSGLVDVDLDLAASGATSDAALASLKGTSRVRLKEGRFEALGLDAVQIAADSEQGQPLRMNGNFNWHQQPMRIEGMLGQLNDLIAGKEVQADVKLHSDIASGSYAGLLTPGEKPRFDGKLKAETASLRRLATLLETSLPAEKGFGAAILEAAVKGNTEKIDFATQQLVVDAVTLQAKGSLQPGGERPQLDADIAAERIDLSAYTAEPATRAITPANALPSLPDTKIDFSGLKALDGRVGLKFKQLKYAPALLENGDTETKLDNGRLYLTIRSVEAYRGKVEGKLNLDGSSDLPGVNGKLQLRDVLTGAILRDFANVDRIAGKGAIDVELSGKGKTPGEMLATLNGSTSIKLTDGRVEGIDIANLITVKPENLPSGFPKPLVPVLTSDTGKLQTQYKQMSGRFDLKQGVAGNEDFLMVGNDYRVKAAGTINLPGRSLAYRVVPTFFTNSFPLPVPVRISGPWGKLKTELDAFAYAGSSAKTTTTVRSLESVRKVLPLPEKPDDALATKRGLKTEAEIDAYLAGDKIDVSKNGIVPH